MKFTAWRKSLTGDTQGAILQKVYAAGGGEKGGKEVVEAILRGELEIEFKDGTLKFFNKNGRCIPYAGMKAPFTDANREFHLVQPSLDEPHDCAERLVRFNTSYQADVVSLDEFATRSMQVIEKINKDVQTRNLLKGVHLPICFPKLAVDDYGETLEQVFIASLERAYKAQYPERVFTNYRAGTLAKQVEIVQGTRHERLLKAITAGPMVALYFPNPMQGFSIPADREMIAKLPEQLLLSGAIDTVAGCIGYADIMARDYQTPGYDCAANTWRSARFALCLRARDGGLGFVHFDGLGALDSYSGGLLVLG